MQSSFRMEVLLMYRKYCKEIMKRQVGMRESLLEKVRNEFKVGSKISRKSFVELDDFFSHSERRLQVLKESNIERVSSYTPSKKS